MVYLLGTTMNATRLLTVAALAALVPSLPLPAQDSSSGFPYDQKMDVVYGEAHGVGLLMDVFSPKGKANGLGIIDVVSGGYSSDRRKIRDHTLAQVYSTLCSRGYTVFAVRPGSRSRFNGQDMAAHVKVGIRYVKQHAADYRIDVERLGLTGASAGGHLALLAAVVPQDGDLNATSAPLRHSTHVKAVAVFFPPTDFLDWDGKLADMKLLGDLLFLGGGQGRSEEEIKAQATRLSPARLVKNPSVPFLFFHGDADPIVPLQQSEKMVAALKAAGADAELIVKPGGGHPWMTLPEEVKVMANWFDKRLSAGAASEAASGQ